MANNYLLVTVFDATWEKSRGEEITSLKVKALSNDEEVTGEEIVKAIEKNKSIIAYFGKAPLKVSLFESIQGEKNGIEIDDEASFSLSSNNLSVWISPVLSRQEKETQQQAAAIRRTREEEARKIAEQPIRRIFGDLELTTIFTEAQFKASKTFDCEICPAATEVKKTDIDKGVEFGKAPIGSVLKDLLRQKTYNSFNLKSLEEQSKFCKDLLAISYLTSASQPIQRDVLSIFQQSSKLLKTAGVSAYKISDKCGDCAQSTIDIFKTVTEVTGDTNQINETKRKAILDLNLLADRAKDIADEAKANATAFEKLAERCNDVAQAAVTARATKEEEGKKVEDIDNETKTYLKKTQEELKNTKNRRDAKIKEYEETKNKLDKLEDRQFGLQITGLVTQCISTIGSAAVSLSSPYKEVTAVAKEMQKIRDNSAEKESEFNSKKAQLDEITKKLTDAEKEAEQWCKEVGNVVQEILSKQNVSKETKNKVNKIQENLKKYTSPSKNLPKNSSEEQESNKEKEDVVTIKEELIKSIGQEIESLVKEDKEQNTTSKGRMDYLQDKKKILEDLYLKKPQLAALFNRKKEQAQIIQTAGKELATALKDQAKSMESVIDRQNKLVSEIRKEKEEVENAENQKKELIVELASKVKTLAAQKVDINIAIMMLSVTIISLSRLAELYQDMSLFWQGVETSARALQRSGLANALEKVELTSLSREVALEWYFNTCLWLAIQEACKNYHGFSTKLGEELDITLSSIQSTPQREKEQALTMLKKFEAEKIPNLSIGVGEELDALFKTQEKLKQEAEKETADMMAKAEEIANS